MKLADLELLEHLAAAEARESFWAFRQYMNPHMKKGWWQRDVARVLQQFIEELVAGKRPKYVLEAPPQHGKSYQIIDLIAWVSGKYPHLRNIFASFSDRLGIRANLRLQRIMDSEKFQKVFPYFKLKPRGDLSIVATRTTELLEYLRPDWSATEGSFRNTTVNGAITGEGLDCVVAGTLVETDIGPIPIEELESLCYSVKALSFKDGVFSYEEISGFTHRKSVGIYRITTDTGRVLEATGNHQFFTPETNGYTCARDLSEGQTLLCSMPQGLFEGSLRNIEMEKGRKPNNILQPEMPFKLFQSKFTQKMFGMLKANREGGKIRYLLSRMFADFKGKKERLKASIKAVNLHDMQQSIHRLLSRQWKVCNLLRKALCSNRPFAFDVRTEKSNVETWRNTIKGTTSLSQSLSHHEAKSNCERWKLLRFMQNISKQFAGSSHRQLANEQCGIKSNYSLPKMSRSNPPLDAQWRYEKIAAIEILSIESDTYDIVVNRNHNFFANGILVHNCGFIDDPIKGRKEAGSETVRNATWDWFTDDFFTRFSEDAGFIFILTRWHVDDPVGRLLSEMPDGVKVFKYPALAIDGAKLMPTDPRAPGSGEALFPEHKSAEFILERKRLQAAANFESLYQQNPQILGGEIIKGQWFQRYKMPPKILFRCIYADTAQKIKEANDYSVFECWGKGEDGKIYLLDLIRGKWEAPELRKRAKDFWAKHQADVAKGALRAMKVEDKSSGTGLIQDLKINERIPVVPIPRGGPGSDKLTRVMGVVSYIESGYVCVPEDAPWVSDFIDECEAFTADDTHAFDDQIDPMCDAIEDLLAAKPRGIVDVLSHKKG